MGERLALVGVEQDDVACLSLRLAQGQPQADPLHGVSVLAAFQRVAGTAIAQAPFFRSTTESRDLEIVTPVRRSISDDSRGNVQFGRSATGADKISSATASAACAFTGGRLGSRETRPSTPTRRKIERQSRTTSSRTPKASPMRALVQPSSVNKIARARSASARSRDDANRVSPSLCSPDATIGDRPAMITSVRVSFANHKYHPLAPFGN